MRKLSTQIRVDRLKNSAYSLEQNENLSFYPSIVSRSHPSVSPSDRPSNSGNYLIRSIAILFGLIPDRNCFLAIEVAGVTVYRFLNDSPVLDKKSEELTRQAL
jgi:hypothetical protein